jgi:outer membrane immunogenic protein
MRRAIIKFLAIVGLGLGFVAAASAAPVTPRPSSPYYNWTGFYVGGIAGGAWGTADASTSTVSVPGDEFGPLAIASFNSASPQRIKPDAFLGGIETGYNWQPNNFVFGLEGDIQWFRFSGSTTAGPLPINGTPGTFFTLTSNASVDWLATARGRIGFATGNWLFYATGGAAFTTLHGNFLFTETLTGSSESASISSSRVRPTVGGGVEAYLWQHWSVKAEYLYVDFGSATASGVDAGFFIPVQPFTHTMDLKLNIARLGLNYHF